MKLNWNSNSNYLINVKYSNVHTITQIQLKPSGRHPPCYARFDEFCNFPTNSESVGHRIRYPETQTQCIERISRHSDLQPIREAIFTFTTA